MGHWWKKIHKLHIKFFAGLLLILLACFGLYQVFSVLFPPAYDNKEVLPIPSDDSSIGPIVEKTGSGDIIIPLKTRTYKNHLIPLLAGEEKERTDFADTQPVEGSEGEDQITEIMGRVQEFIKEKKLVEARELLNGYLRTRIGYMEDPAIEDLAIELGRETILSAKVYPNDPLAEWYKVKRGDLLIKIARRCKVPYKLICKINGIKNPRRLRAGTDIKLVKGPINVKVISHKLVAYIYLQNTLIGKYKVGLGKDNKTPLGVWLVVDKVKNPVYCDPDTGITYGADDPKNPTGGYWVRLEGIRGNAIGKVGFGIHGTNEPESIGKFMSRGCIRLYNKEMAELFDMLFIRASKVYTLP